MKITGITRRIDGLGRIVIPKELRRSLRIEEYDTMEINGGPDGSIILKKYYPLSSLGNYIPEFVNTLYWALGCDSLICDRDTVIASSGPNSRYYNGKKLHQDIMETINHVNIICLDDNQHINITSDINQKNYKTQVIAPIHHNGNSIGAVILLLQPLDSKSLNLNIKFAETIAYLIGQTIN